MQWSASARDRVPGYPIHRSLSTGPGTDGDEVAMGAVCRIFDCHGCRRRMRGYALGVVRSEEASPSFEKVKISHFDGSKLYQRGPLR